MLFKNLDFEYKADTSKRTFEGYASTWERDLGNDIIKKGAFSKTIQERFPKGKIKILWQHSEPLGLPTHMEEDSKGLYVVGRISKTKLGDDALELMSDGVVDQMSIGYDVVKDDLSDDGQTRELKELKLFEFSPVTFPMNEGTSITSVQKSHFYDFNFKELTNLLRELKEGRALSSKNIGRIEGAIKNLQAVLDESNPKNYNPSNDSYKGFNESGENSLETLINEMKNYAKSKGVN